MSDEFLGHVSSLLVPQIDIPINQAQRARRSGWVQGKFLRGPIPLVWLRLACKLSRSTLFKVAVAIWYVSGLNNHRRDDLKLTTKVLEYFFVTDRAGKYRALKTYEEAGLITVKRQRGKNPLVTILDCSAGEEGN